MHEQAAFAMATEMGEHGAAPSPVGELIDRDDELVRRRLRYWNARPHDGDAAAHACASTGGQGTSWAMNVRHHSARFSRYQRFEPSAASSTRSTSAASSRSVS